MDNKLVVTFATIFIIFFVLLFAYTKLAGPIPFQVNSITTTKSTTFDVTGEGKSTIKPDLGIVSAGISATGDSVKSVQDQINSIINKVSAAIKEQGVDPKDIQTSNYNINPTYDLNFPGGTQKITGYSANTNLTIKVRDIEKVGKVIDAATAAGATNVGSLGFEASDKSKAENEARKQAVAEARKKAEAAAQIAGFKLGRIINYSENFGGFPPPRLLVEQAVKEGAPPTQIEPGTNEVTITVTLSYEIK